MSNEQLPPPGIDGTHSGACIACLHGTDSGVFLRGVVEFHVAAMTSWGIPEDQALFTFQIAWNEYHPDNPPLTGKNVPDGVLEMGYRLCQQCADNAKMPGVGVLPMLPLYEDGRNE